MTHPANKARGKYAGYFDDLCATCDRPIPFCILWTLQRLGWGQRADGAWVCGVGQESCQNPLNPFC